MSKRGNRVVVVRLATADLAEVRSFRPSTCVFLHVFFIVTAVSLGACRSACEVELRL